MTDRERRVLELLDRSDVWVSRAGVLLILLTAIGFGGAVGLSIVG